MTVYASTARYKRRKAAGDKYLSIWFTPATLAVLRDLQRKGGTVENTIAGALLNTSQQMRDLDFKKLLAGCFSDAYNNPKS